LKSYARKEYLKELQRKSLMILDRSSINFVWPAHDTPSLIKLRVLLRICSTKRPHRLLFWVSIFKRAIYVVFFWDYYSFKKRFAFAVWIFLCFLLPKTLVLWIVRKTVYAHGRGY
jgi:hypothetical protein